MNWIRVMFLASVMLSLGATVIWAESEIAQVRRAAPMIIHSSYVTTDPYLAHMREIWSSGRRNTALRSYPLLSGVEEAKQALGIYADERSAQVAEYQEGHLIFRRLKPGEKVTDPGLIPFSIH